ncbi:MAG: hypothetical protein WBV93_20010 [Anaerobacillus sp.]
MDHKKLRIDVKKALFQKEHFPKRNKERMLENILIHHYSSRKKHRNHVMEWIGIVACIVLLITTTIHVTGIEIWSIDTEEASNLSTEVPYVSAAYMKRATEIARRESKITDVSYFSRDSNMHLEIMVPDSLSDKEMKKLAENYLKLVSHLYRMENHQLGDLWNEYKLDIVIKSSNEYVSLNYVEEEDSFFFLKGSKEREESKIDWLSTSK